MNGVRTRVSAETIAAVVDGVTLRLKRLVIRPVANREAMIEGPMGLFRKKLFESEAAAAYVSSVFKPADSAWGSFVRLLEKYDASLAAIAKKPLAGQIHLALALIASSFASAVHYSPAFATRRALAQRLSSWALFTVLKNAESHIRKDILSEYRRYEAIAVRAAAAENDPCTAVANALFLEIFRHDLGAFMVEGTNEVDPFVANVFTDLFMIAVTDTFNALRYTTENYKLVSCR